MAERTPQTGSKSQRDVAVGTPELHEDAPWLVAAAGLGLTVLAAYLVTHTHPAYEGGLFLQIVAEIQTNGYALPTQIPYYTEGGIPFAYPPLLFYVAAVVVDLTGVDPVGLMLVAPGLVLTAALVPYFYIAKELLGSARRAGYATLVFGVAPPVLQWHISAGGLVRAPALLFVLTGLYAGLRAYRTGGRDWHAIGALMFGLTVLTHPMYATFFGLSYVLLFVAFDRELRGLFDGVTVAAGGLALALPWLALVATTHGPDVFLAASGTHDGLAGGLDRLKVQFAYPFIGPDAVTPFYAVAFAGAAYGLLTRRVFLSVWLVAGSYLIGEQRFAFVAGAMLCVVFAFEVIVPASVRFADWAVGWLRLRWPEDSRRRLGRGSWSGQARAMLSQGGVRRSQQSVLERAEGLSPSRQRSVALAVVALLVLGASGVGAAYAGGALDSEYADSASQPQTVDADDRRAMAWLGANTGPDATVAATGDAAEWLPYYAKRTSVVSPWGSEWLSSEEYYQQDTTFKGLSACDTESCVTATLAEATVEPDYVYLPKGEYTVRGEEHQQSDRLASTMQSSDRYRLVYANDGVMIYRVIEPPRTAQPPPAELERR